MKLTETIEENYAEVTGKNNLRIIQTNADPNIEKLLDIYDRSMQRISSANAHDDFLINNVQTDVGSALKYYQSINDPLILSSNLIKEFCFALSSREKEENFEYSGIFLTGLIYRTIKEIKDIVLNSELRKNKNEEIFTKYMTSYANPSSQFCDMNLGTLPN